jgi:biofilm PGA synthesis protein PgaA
MTNYKHATFTDFAVCLLLCAAAAVSAAADCAGAGDAEYQAGLAQYHAGQLQSAYDKLKSAYQECPAQERYRNDYLVSAVSAGHAAEALAIAATLDPVVLPPYLLEALGRGARDQRDPGLAIHYFDLILAAGDNPAVRVGRDLALIDQGDAAQAQADLLDLYRRYPERVDVLEGLGLADEARSEWIPALAAAQALLLLDPGHAGALALRYRVLVAVGAPQLATALTPPEATAPAQRSAALQAALAFEFRWARDSLRSDRIRAAHLDEVIAHMRAAVADPSTTASARLAIRADLVEVLQERGLAREAVAQYESIVKEGGTVPTHATGAAIDAYLTLRMPERSVALYRGLPAGSDPAFSVRASYFYALLESGRYSEAIAWADALAASEPQFLDAGSPGLRSNNDDYMAARVLAGLARAYTEQLADAGRRIDALVDRAPANTDADLALAEVEALRGWPRDAAETVSGVLQANPDLAAATAKLFGLQLQMGDWSAAHATLGELEDSRPADDPVLARAQRDWQIHASPEVTIDGQIGRSYGQRLGIIDSTVEEYAYTAPFAFNYRAYVHLDQAEGEPVQGDTYRHAAGAGIEYHTADWLATVELLDIDGAGLAPQLSLEATPNDSWRFGGSYSQRTLDIPIAAVVVGVHANRAALDLGYRASEALELGVNLKHEQFSDTNSRYEEDGFWRERWVEGPVYNLDTRVDLDTSSNTLANTNYYNPTRDASATVTLQNQWLQFRHYDRALTHELDVSAGDYHQDGYGSGLIASLRYSVNYEINDRLVVKAGLGRGIRPYDGSRERLDVITFNALGRF